MSDSIACVALAWFASIFAIVAIDYSAFVSLVVFCGLGSIRFGVGAALSDHRKKTSA